MKVDKAISLIILVLVSAQTISSQILYLKIDGENEIETEVIDSLNYKNQFSDFITLNREVDSLQKKLQKVGFIENILISSQKINDSTIHAKFSLKKKFYTIYIYYDKNDLSKSLLTDQVNEVTDTYFVLSIQQTEKILNYLNSKIIENGDPFASLKLIELKKKDTENLQARLIITYDRKRFIDEIIIKGYEKFPRSFFNHFLRIKKDEVFNLEKIKQKTEAFEALQFANQTRSPEVLFTNDSTSIYFYIEKVKSNTFDGFLGFGTNETTNKIEFDGYLNLQLKNNLNYGETFRLAYKSDENEQKSFDVNLNLPYLFKTALGTELGLNIFKKDSSYTTVYQSANLFYQLNANQKVYLGINGQQSNNLLNNDDNENIKDYNTVFFSITYDYLKPQLNSSFFSENFGINLKLGFGSRTVESINETQQVYNFQTFKIFDLNTKNSIFINANSSGIFSSTYFDNELLRFGGINSIRGFEENSLNASLFGVINTEYRYQVNQSLYVHSIFDAAYLDNSITHIDQKLFGLGFGFGLITKAGLLKFNYANGKFEDQKFTFSNSKIHLSLNARF